MPTAKLKIGLVFDDTLDSADGVAQYVKTVGTYLSVQGHQVRYLVGETKLSEWSGGRVYSLAKNVGVRFNGNRLSVPGVSHRRQIKQVLAAENFDILHVMVPYSPFLAARIIKMAPKKTVIIGTFHIFPAGWLPSAGSRLLRLMLYRSSRRFAKVLAVSQASADFARSAYGLDPEVLPNAIDLSKFRVAKPKEQKDIVFLGRLVERKGAAQLLEAFKLLSNELPDVKLKIAGRGAMDTDLRKFVHTNNLDSRVEFLGFVSEEEKARLLASAAIACFPSLYGEAFGIVLIEAMAAGASVVLGGDNPGYRSVLGDQELLLVNPRETKKLAERLKLLLSDKKLASRLHGWQQTAIGQYDVTEVGRQLEDLYAEQIAIKGKIKHN